MCDCIYEIVVHPRDRNDSIIPKIRNTFTWHHIIMAMSQRWEMIIFKTGPRWELRYNHFMKWLDCCQTQVRVLHHIIFKFIIIDYFAFSRQAVVLVRFTILTAWISQKLGPAWSTRTFGKVGRCYGLGVQWQNVLLQWHYVLEVSIILENPNFLNVEFYFQLHLLIPTFFCRFDEEVGRVELDYPRDMAMWKGVGYNIDSVFQWKDGKKALLTKHFSKNEIILKWDIFDTFLFV